MIDFHVDSLRALLQRMADNQDTPADRTHFQQLLRDLVDVLSNPTIPSSLSDAISALKVNELETHSQLARLERRTAELDGLRQVSMTLTASLELRQTLRAILVELLRMVKNIANTHIFMYENGRLQFGAAIFAEGQQQGGGAFSEPRSHGITYTVARLGKSVLIPDMSEHQLFAGTGWTGSIAGIPLKIGSRVIGVLVACRQPPEEFTGEETRLLQVLADQAALAVELSRLQGLVKDQAQHDPLTGLFTRRSLEERLESEILRYKAIQESQSEFGKVRSFALLIVDLDGFKKINERFGHLAGDYVLREISQAAAQALRKTDFLARYGGDELAVVLSEVDPDIARQIALRIQDYVMRTRVSLPNFPAQALTVSIGAALFPEQAGTAHELIGAAEAALAEARQSGSTAALAFSSRAPAPGA